MTSHPARLYALALAILVFFLSWAAVSARPWVTGTTASAAPASGADLAALRARERALKKQIVAAKELLGAEAVQAALPPVEAASAPVQVVDTPPATVTRSS